MQKKKKEREIEKKFFFCEIISSEDVARIGLC